MQLWSFIISLDTLILTDICTQVAILKSRDTLRKAQQKPHEQFLNSQGESNSCFVSKLPIGTPEKISFMTGLKAYEPTPIKEFHSILHAIDTPASNKRM